jgi:hypothetical protein
MPKKKEREIVFVHGDSGDWEGIYVDGKLLREDHSLDPDDVLSVLGIAYETHWIDMEDGSRLPKDLSELAEKIAKSKEAK